MIEVTSGSKGIDWMLLTMKWSRNGLVASLQVDPRVEEFFTQVTQGQSSPLGTYGGKDWIPVEGEAPLMTYNISEETFRDTNQFYMGYPGYGFSNERFPNKINLSFLHLVGASKGLKFIIKTPVSGMMKSELRIKTERGLQEFVRQYLTFGKMVLRVSSYEDL